MAVMPLRSPGRVHSPIERCLWGYTRDPLLGVAIPLPLCCPDTPRLAAGPSLFPDLSGGCRGFAYVGDALASPLTDCWTALILSGFTAWSVVSLGE